jgi:hypothetical protein
MAAIGADDSSVNVITTNKRGSVRTAFGRSEAIDRTKVNHDPTVSIRIEFE